MKRLVIAMLALTTLVLLLIFTTLVFNSEEEGIINFGSLSLRRPGAVVKNNYTPPVDESVAKLSARLTAGLDNDYDKLSVIYDWVTDNITYDLDKAANLSAYDSGAAYALANSSGVCHDYALLTKELLQAVGIEATYERGEVAVREGEYELHAWNEVVADGIVYAVDTTWGAGFIIEDKSAYIQKPRSIYLTTPEELERLHSDPAYKQDREEEYLLKITALEPTTHLPELEASLLKKFNNYRKGINLEPLAKDSRLAGLALEHAEISAEAICMGENVDFNKLSDELNELAPAINARSAGMHILVKWLYPLISVEDTLAEIVAEQAVPLGDNRWQAVSMGIVQKGDLLIFVSIFLEYH